MIEKGFLLLTIISLIKSSSIKIDHEDLTSSIDFDNSIGLYGGKPVCVSIPSNMTLCKNINYNKMKLPNLLGHDTLDEVEYQSSQWIPLLSVNCHPDTQMFLCSMFAPVCLPNSLSIEISPCKSLCESVKKSCEAKMLSYNYPWPSIFNCSKFPTDNGLCVEPSSSSSSSSDVIVTSTTKQAIIKKIIKKPANSSSNSCHACQTAQFKMEKIVENYCKSDLVFRGRIQSIKLSHLDLIQSASTTQMSKSLYAKITKRDRKVLKGHLSLQASQLKKYLHDEINDDDEQSGSSSNRDIYLYLLSENHLRNSNASSLLTLKLNQTTNSRYNGHCLCDMIRRNKNKNQNKKYFITANILKAKNLDLLQRKEKSRVKNIIYMTGIFDWNKSRAFVDYLEDDSIDKTNMCLQDSKLTVREINKAQKKLF